jgi:hypothetical protein
MSAPSSQPERARVPGAVLGAALGTVILGAAAGGCGGKKVPEADPAAFVTLAGTMLNNVPPPGATPCTDPQVLGGATMTMRTLLEIAKRPYEDRPERHDFVNPPELDVPAARVLIDPKAGERDRRRAAAELTAAPFYLVYNIDHVDVPMALGFKELKLGIASGRALRYDLKGNLECVRVFSWHNDEKVSEDAITRSDKAVIDPAIAKMLRDDLTAQLLRRIAGLSLPPPAAKEMSKKPSDH